MFSRKDIWPAALKYHKMKLGKADKAYEKAADKAAKEAARERKALAKQPRCATAAASAAAGMSLATDYLHKWFCCWSV